MARDKATKEFLKLLEEGCSATCDVDESEGGLVCHCNGCQLQLIQMARELFIEQGREIGRRLKGSSKSDAS